MFRDVLITLKIEMQVPHKGYKCVIPGYNYSILFIVVMFPSYIPDAVAVVVQASMTTDNNSGLVTYQSSSSVALQLNRYITR